jgi:MFS family permease
MRHNPRGAASRIAAPGWVEYDRTTSASIARRGEPVMIKQERAARLLAGALFLALFFLWGAGYSCFPIFLPSMLKQFHLSRLQVGLVPGVQAITAGVFGLLVGWLLDRVPAQIVMAVGAVLTAVGIVMMSQAASLHSLLAGSVVTGIGMVASTILPASMVISNWFGERRGTALGITMAGMELGGMVITMLAGYLIMAALALCLFIGAVNTTLLRSRAISRRHRLLHRVIRGLRAGRTGGRRCFISLRGACAGIGGMVRAK